MQKRGLLSWSFLNGLTSINVLNADVMACSLFIVSISWITGFNEVEKEATYWSSYMIHDLIS